MEAKPYILRWMEPGPREAVPCSAARRANELAEGAEWLPFFVPRPKVGRDGDKSRRCL